MKKLVLTIAVSLLVILVSMKIYLSNSPKWVHKSNIETHMEVLRKVDSIQNNIEEQVRLEYEMRNRVEAYRDSIQIIKYYTSNPNSAGGVDFNLVWKNNTKKTIKYVSWYVSAINAVEDEVYSRHGIVNSPKIAQSTGPIKPGQIRGYGYSWECLWYNHSISKSKLRKVEIEFMDGTEVSFTL
mgnify:FL=1|tara:strand:- start:56 stop:604 length:549 start_codon:yes stop_codon:yes gene_type:complete